MTRNLLITGATDGLGRATARAFARQGHRLIIHGRNAGKLADTAEELRAAGADVTTQQADLSDLAEVAEMARRIIAAADPPDVLINNAGVFRTTRTRTDDGLDVRFVVNTFAPALLARMLADTMPAGGRIVHLSSAAQARVDLAALAGERAVDDMAAYAQSKLALTVWSQEFAGRHPDGPISVAVNPGSLLATRMVRDGFGTAGNDIEIGVTILVRAALSDDFAGSSGRYFDNDTGRFAAPHADAADADRVRAIVGAIDHQIAAFL